MIEKNTYNRLNVLGISDLVIFKGNEMTIKIKKEVGHNLEQRLAEDQMMALGITVKEGKASESYNMDDFYRSGVLLEVKHIQYENDFYVLKIKATEKIRVERFIEVEGELMAEYYISPDAIDLEGPALKALLDHVKGLVKDISVYFKGSEPFVKYIEEINDIELLAGVLLQYLQIPIDDKYTIFEIPTSSDKGLKLIDVLKKQIEAFTFQKEMADKFSTEANKNYRKAFLREQLKAIQEELNEGKPEHGKKDYQSLIEESTMPEDVKQIALDEVAKMEGLSPQSAERNVVINYLDLLVSLPWGRFKAPEIDIENARELLEKEHYGLKEVKDRIIQHLAVMKLKKEKQGSILLLVGPPGTGKTSLGKSIAEALGRPYVRMSLGGVRDEAEIRGHRRTYVAALPGRVIQGMKKAKQTNPVFVLDEIDKLQIGNSGDPASALLEVLDPEQNNSFQDHYLEVPLPFAVKADTVEELLGHPVARHDVIGKENAPGVVTGLAWTPVGGEILFIEGSFMPGTGQLILTGKLGDVMKESARISLSLVNRAWHSRRQTLSLGRKTFMYMCRQVQHQRMVLRQASHYLQLLHL